MFENEEEGAGEKFAYEQVAEDEPTVFSDFSNPLMQHVKIFRIEINKQTKKGRKILFSLKQCVNNYLISLY